MAVAAVIIVGGLVLVMLGVLVFGTPEGNLRKSFAELGNLRGRTKQEIIAAVGPPNSVTQAGGGRTILQWMRNGGGGAYHIALVFDAAGRFESISHEHSA